MSERNKKNRFTRLRRRFARRIQRLTADAKRKGLPAPAVRKGNDYLQEKETGQ